MRDVDKIKQLIEQAEELIKTCATRWKPEFEAWHSRTERFLNSKYGEKSIELKNFMSRPFTRMVYISGEKHDNSIECTRDLRITINELNDYLFDEEEKEKIVNCNSYNFESSSFDRIFIIHGHDGELKEMLARLIEKQGIDAIILSEQTNQGKTIIEKIEEYSDVGAAIALFTNDDFGRSKISEKDEPRARQNVVFETGFFMGKLGRDKVVIIAEKGVELPSDLQGVVYTDKTDWKIDVCRELKTMNYNIDFNKLF